VSFNPAAIYVTHNSSSLCHQR